MKKKKKETTSDEMKSIILTCNEARFANNQLIKTRFLTRLTNIKLCKTVTKLVVIYSVESWMLKKIR